MILSGMIFLGLVCGWLLPLRWGVAGFLATSGAMFLIQAAIHTARGYEGLPFSETMLLFNNSWPSYIGYNLQITYRAFVVPLLALAAVLVFRFGRAS